jgi:hypothetical protein
LSDSNVDGQAGRDGVPGEPRQDGRRSSSSTFQLVRWIDVSRSPIRRDTSSAWAQVGDLP